MAARQRRRALSLPVTLGFAAALALLMTLLLGITAGAAAAAAALIAGSRRTSPGRNSWAIGAAGERRTARMLRPLTWTRRYAVLHDRGVPRSRANLDHLIVGRSGLIYVDTKNWTSVASKVLVKSDGQLWYGDYPQGPAVSTVRWEADQVQRVLGWPVHAVIVVHGARLPEERIHLDGVTVIQARDLRRYIRSLPDTPGWDRALMRETTRIADSRLAPASARCPRQRKPLSRPDRYNRAKSRRR
ncbi:nuclease-related domain-containing protein [Streptomyces sp. NPDC002817]|uniref:nuclease-related domain-containing protein n=1 Tax=Streptomyces sp. NPDC088357 TaxID=3154655 RepID=UPI00342A4904